MCLSVKPLLILLHSKSLPILERNTNRTTSATNAYNDSYIMPVLPVFVDDAVKLSLLLRGSLMLHRLIIVKTAMSYITYPLIVYI